MKLGIGVVLTDDPEQERQYLCSIFLGPTLFQFRLGGLGRRGKITAAIQKKDQSIEENFRAAYPPTSPAETQSYHDFENGNSPLRRTAQGLPWKTEVFDAK